MPRPSRSDDSDQIRLQVRTVYDELAARPVERSCQRLGECCYFKQTGLTPYLTKGEALVAAKALRATGRSQLPKREDGACPLLDSTNRCLIYRDRPFGCRTHYCKAAGGPYGRSEVVDLIHKLEEIDRKLGGRGALPLPAAVEQALAEKP